MGKIYIVDYYNYEYNDEYFYSEGSVSPGNYFTKKSEAQKQLRDSYRYLLTVTKEDLYSYVLRDDAGLIEDVPLFQHDLKIIGSLIEVPKDPLDNVDWIPTELTDQEIDVFIEHLTFSLGNVKELSKYE